MLDKKRINELVETIGKGDSSATEELYLMLYKPLFSFVYAKTDDRAATEDIIQDVFLAVIRNAKQVRYDNCFAWIFTIARNASSDLVNRRKREMALDEVDPALLAVQPQFTDLSLFFNNLVPEEEQILRLKISHGYTFAEIGEILKTTERIVKYKYYNIINNGKKLATGN